VEGKEHYVRRDATISLDAEEKGSARPYNKLIGTKEFSGRVHSEEKSQ